MGLFSSKKKKVSNTSMVRMIEDKDIPDMGKSALFDYLFADRTKSNTAIKIDHSYSDYLAYQSANSIGTKYRTARNWSKNKYAYGVPEGNVVNQDKVDMVAFMQAHLEYALGRRVKMHYALFAPLNALHFTWMALNYYHGYNFRTNMLSNGYYLHDIQINYCTPTIDNLVDPETLLQYGPAATAGVTPFRQADDKRQHTPYVNNPTAQHDYALVTTVRKDATTGEPIYRTIEINFLEYEWSGYEPATGLDDSDTDNYEPEAITPIAPDNEAEHDFIMCKYTLYNTNGTETEMLFTYQYGSNLDSKLENIFNADKLLGNYNPNMYFRLMGTKLNSDAYKDTNEYITSKQLGTRLGLDWSSLTDQLHDSIGSVGEVTQLLLTTAIQVNTEDKLLHRYLYDYFLAVYRQLPTDFAGTEYDSLQKSYVNGYAKIGQTIEIKDKVYSCKLSFASIGYEDKIGKIGEVGEVIYKYESVGVRKSKGLFRNIAAIPCHTFTKQLTENSYRVITIYGLTSTQKVTGGKDTTASYDDENLIVPLDLSLINNFNQKERTLLYSKSLLFIINTVKVIKTKWYQTGVFKAVMFVVAVIVSVFTSGAGMSIYAVLYAVAQSLVVGVVLSMVVKFLVNKLNMNLGGVFAVVAVLAALAGGAAALSKSGSIMGMTSTQFMQAANYSVSISSQSNQLQMIKMGKAHAEFMDVMQEKFDHLNEMQKEMLKTDIMLNPAFLMSESIRGPDIRVGEDMSSFIMRTLSVDAGLATLDTIPNMVELTVRLPKLSETTNKLINDRGDDVWTMI